MLSEFKIAFIIYDCYFKTTWKYVQSLVFFSKKATLIMVVCLYSQ